MMTSYRVTVKAITGTEPGAFVGLERFDPDAWSEPVDEMASAELMEHFETTDLEVYEVHGSGDLSRFFDNSDRVVEYREI